MSGFFSVMTWPVVACLLLPGILVYLGLHIVRREIIFVDLALAQVAALGTCLGLLLGREDYQWQTCLHSLGLSQSICAWAAPHVNDWQTYLLALGFTFIGAVIFTFTRNAPRHHVP